MRKFRFLISTVALALGLALPAVAGTLDDGQKADVENIIRSYMLSHPELLREMIKGLEEQERVQAAATQAGVLSVAAKDIFHNGLDAVVGNPKGDVTIVEFMDYNCGWCRKAVKEVQDAIGEDKNIRVVMKEWPIFGKGSEYAARAAMAASRQGKYWELHQALFAFKGEVNEAVTDKVAQSVGIDLAKLKADMKDPAIEANVQANEKLAQSLQFTGTPGFVIDKDISPGFITKDRILASVGKSRAAGGCKDC